MTISSSLNAGVSGLSSNASRLAAISDNISNSGTIGYKRAQTSFRALVTSSGTGSYTAGGVSVSTTRLIDQPGALRTTANSTDLAVRGRGFLPVTPVSALSGALADYPLNLATTGSFRPDEAGFLVNDTGTFVLMGWPANPDGTIPDFARDTADGLQPVQISVNQATGEPTTEIDVGVNLPATETEFGATAPPLTLPVEYFDNLGRSQTLTMTFSPVPPAAAGDPPTNTWTLVITDSALPDSATPPQPGSIGEFTVVFDDSREQGGTLDSVTVVGGGPNPPAVPPVPAIAPAWDPATGELTIGVAGGQIDIGIGLPGASGGLTQFSDSFSPRFINKDGSPVGSLQAVEVDQNGFVRANFDNGLTRIVFQIPLVDMPNPNGLVMQDGQTYIPSTESGSFFLWEAGEGATGDIVSFALEESATDVAGELTALIQTQRAYSSNAKVIQTVDEMLQETTNIKR
ncbi:MAG: flagellar hook-basal body complex protein [Pseudomonadota bacterium]